MTYTHTPYRMGFRVNKPKPPTDDQVYVNLSPWGRFQWLFLRWRRASLRRRYRADIKILAEKLGRQMAAAMDERINKTFSM